jgi:hypothetical protein
MVEKASWGFVAEPTPDDLSKASNALREELSNVDLKTCQDLLKKIAGPPARETLPGGETESNREMANEHQKLWPPFVLQTLHEYLYNDTFVMQLVSEGGVLKAI